MLSSRVICCVSEGRGSRDLALHLPPTRSEVDVTVMGLALGTFVGRSENPLRPDRDFSM